MNKICKKCDTVRPCKHESDNVVGCEHSTKDSFVKKVVKKIKK